MREISPAERAAARAELANDLSVGVMADAKESGSLSRLVMAGDLAVGMIAAPGVAQAADSPMMSLGQAQFSQTQRTIITDGCNPRSLESIALLHHAIQTHELTETEKTDLERSLALLNHTPEGAHLLHRAHLNGVRIGTLPQRLMQGSNAMFVPSLNTVLITSQNLKHPALIGHELKHAENFHYRLSVTHLTGPEIARIDKAEYVSNFIREEANAHAAEVLIAGDLRRINATKALDDYVKDIYSSRRDGIAKAYYQVQGASPEVALPYMTEAGMEGIRNTKTYIEQAEKIHDQATKCVTQSVAEPREDGKGEVMVNAELRAQRRAALLEKAQADYKVRHPQSAALPSYER